MLLYFYYDFSVSSISILHVIVHVATILVCFFYSFILPLTWSVIDDPEIACSDSDLKIL